MGYTYQFLEVDGDTVLLWGTFRYDMKKMFLFASYLLGMNDYSNIIVHEMETHKAVKLTSFCDHFNITKDDIKKA